MFKCLLLFFDGSATIPFSVFRKKLPNLFAAITPPATPYKIGMGAILAAFRNSIAPVLSFSAYKERYLIGEITVYDKYDKT